MEGVVEALQAHITEMEKVLHLLLEVMHLMPAAHLRYMLAEVEVVEEATLTAAVADQDTTEVQGA
jgi:hypothetical protein